MKIHLSIKKRLTEHGVRYRSSQEAMICACCNKHWLRLTDYNYHLKTKKATGEARKVHKTRCDKREYPCEFCGKKFPDSWERARHQNGIPVD